MRSSWFIFAAAITLAAAPVAQASDAVFTFESVVGGNGSGLPGVQAGDPMTIEIVADDGEVMNGRRIWDSDDHVLTRIRIGSLEIVHSGKALFEAVVEAGDSPVSIELHTRQILAEGYTITVNGARNILLKDAAAVDAEDLTVPENWRLSWH